MQLTDFTIRQMVFEVRYADSFLLWDCTGKIHVELAKLWPGTTRQETAPNQQVLQSDVVTLVTSINSARIVLAGPSTIVQYSDQISQSLKIWTENLDITELTRIGTRIIYDRLYDSDESANQAVMDLDLVKFPGAPFFNHKNKPYASDVRLLWRDEELQTQIVVKAEQRQVEISGLNGNPGEKETRVTNHVLLDIDRATRGVVQLTKFRVTDWLGGVRHLVSRDISRFLKTV